MEAQKERQLTLERGLGLHSFGYTQIFSMHVWSDQPSISLGFASMNPTNIVFSLWLGIWMWRGGRLYAMLYTILRKELEHL